MSFRTIILALIMALPSLALGGPSTNTTRAGYSFFGLGLNSIDYEENLAPEIVGGVVDVETNTIFNVAQQSGTYVAFDDDWGFYLVTSSTLSQSRSDESWDVDDTSIRNNKISIKQQRIALLLSKHFRSDKYFLFGAQYNSTEFRRFGANLTPAASDFSLTDNVFSTSSEAESVLELTVVAGMEKTNLFTSAQPGWRYHYQVVIGLPLMTRVSNTEISDGKSFSQGFNGVFGHSRLDYGYQFNKNIFVSINLEFAFSRRSQIDTEVADSFGKTEFPSNNSVNLFPSLAMYWSF